VQTLKASGDDGLTRAEHNVPLPAGTGEESVADPSLHAGTAVGERLLKLLAELRRPCCRPCSAPTSAVAAGSCARARGWSSSRSTKARSSPANGACRCANWRSSS